MPPTSDAYTLLAQRSLEQIAVDKAMQERVAVTDWNDDGAVIASAHQPEFIPSGNKRNRTDDQEASTA